MKRLLPAIALCSAAHAAWAQADAPAASAQLYGLVDAFAGSMRRSDEPGRTKVLNSGGMTTSFWGVRGTESLGDGLQAQFALESFFQPDTGIVGRNGTDPYFSRNAWVGPRGRLRPGGAGPADQPAVRGERRVQPLRHVAAVLARDAPHLAADLQPRGAWRQRVEQRAAVHLADPRGPPRERAL
jgi:hypothetical protein